MEGNNVIAPFVMKTYQMVSDPTTDILIVWGRANNSFIVTEPLDFSRRILPVYFKHNNFSSFVRQLNTYGFRKVDPDRWEFANEHFLRGQKHLLKNIARRKHARAGGGAWDFEKEDYIAAEIVRMKEEQRALEAELVGMSRRLEATERRPQQMMAFLDRVIEDPDLLPLMFAATAEKRRRLVAFSPAEEDEKEEAKPISLLSSSSPENYFRQSPSCSTESSFGRPSRGQFLNLDASCHEATSGFEGNDVGLGVTLSSSAASDNGNVNGNGRYRDGWINEQLGYEMTAFGGGVVESNPPPPPYPFSLLEGGF